MKQARGLGFVYQPVYLDKRTGKRKTAATWWVQYSVRGKRYRESSGSLNRADAVKLLKKRLGAAATSSEYSVGFRVSPQTSAASTRYAASAPTPGASRVPALMSSTPFSPSIRTSEPILRDPRSPEEMELVTRLPKDEPGPVEEGRIRESEN